MEHEKKPAKPVQDTPKKNPGHTNPAHNPPGGIRQDRPGQQDRGQAGQEQTQSYPGIKGPETRELEKDRNLDKEQAKR